MWAAPTLSEAQDHCPAYPPEEYDAEAALEEIQHRADRAADHGEPATVPVAVMNHWIEVLSDG